MGSPSLIRCMPSPDFLGRVNARNFQIDFSDRCITYSWVKTGVSRTVVKKRDLNPVNMKSSNHFPRLQSDCFEVPSKYVLSNLAM